MKTAMLKLPAVLVHAIQDFAFTDKPLWRIGEGLQHVKIELTFKLPTNQPTCTDRGKKPAMSKGAESRKKKPAPAAGEWPRQPLPAGRPPKCQSVLPTPARECLPPTTTTIDSPPPAAIQRPAATVPPATPTPTLSPPKKMPLERLHNQRHHCPRLPSRSMSLTKKTANLTNNSSSPLTCHLSTTT